jgi:diguanylate cyclase (GGDEF)-like protein
VTHSHPVSRRRPGFAILATVIITTIIALLGLSAWDELKFSQYRLGIGISPLETGLQVESVAPDLPADQAGIEPGDIMLRLSGLDIADSESFDRILRQHSQPGKPSELLIFRDDQELILQLSPGIAPDVTALLAQLVLVGAYLGLAVLAARYRNQDVRARLLMIFVCLIALELALPQGWTFHIAYSYAFALFWYLATGVQIALEVHLVSLVPERLRILRRRPSLIPGIYLLGLLVAVTMILLAVDQWFFGTLNSESLLFLFETAIMTGWSCAVALILMWQIYRATTPRGRNQALLILIGLLPWVIYILVSTYWSGWGKLDSSWTRSIENIVLLFFPAAIFLAIFRYGLFDVETLVRRSLVYGVIATFILIFIYALLTTALPWIAEHAGDDIGIWLITAAAVVTGILFRPLRNGIERVVEKGLFPERRALRQQLIDIAAALSSENHMKDLVLRLANETRRALGLSWATVVAIDGPGRELHTAFSEGIAPTDQKSLVRLLGSDSATFESLSRNQRPVTVRRLARRQPEAAGALTRLGAEVLLPLYFQRRMIGILCLASKQSGELFRREEIELLDLFSHQIAASFENLRLFQDATYEGLTGLLRREAVLRQLEIEGDRAVQSQTPLSIAMIDLDRFKSINDTHGHLFGDRILEQVARTMQKSVRAIDSLGRYGGEEFLLVLPDTHLDGASQVGEKVRAAVAELEFTPPDHGPTVQVTISIGIASVDPGRTEHTNLSRALLEGADTALYQAKAQGRNCVMVKDPFV